MVKRVVMIKDIVEVNGKKVEHTIERLSFVEDDCYNERYAKNTMRELAYRMNEYRNLR